jgi:hypothetical protein
MPEPKRPRFDAKLVIPPEADADPAVEPSERAAVRQYVARVGGLERARQALELWSFLDSAGQKRPKAA